MTVNKNKPDSKPTDPKGEVITTETCKSWLGDDGIVWSIMLPQAVETIETAKKNTAAGVTLSGGKKRPLLLDMSKIKSMNKEARDYYARGDKRESCEKAVALIIKSPISRILGNFFLGFNKPTEPTKLFTDEKKALEWLKTFL
ncbi:MAG: STAS/SEC14 domain-containing protein [Candidatus Aminicenantes bacterium]|nr:STAS/SEC14 domain-containing protein [Candidatus Aminicenantes bacterium]